jgi:hypothetical protein
MIHIKIKIEQDKKKVQINAHIGGMGSLAF